MSKDTQATIAALMDQLVDATPIAELKAIAMDNLETNLAGMSTDEQLESLTNQLDVAKKRQEAAQITAQ